MTRILTLAALSTALITSSGNAQQAPATSSAERAAVSDALFALAAADSGLAEMTLAEMGAKMATNPELKKLSQQMLDEHSKMNAELTGVATQKGMTLPARSAPGTNSASRAWPA